MISSGYSQVVVLKKAYTGGGEKQREWKRERKRKKYKGREERGREGSTITKWGKK